MDGHSGVESLRPGSIWAIVIDTHIRLISREAGDAARPLEAGAVLARDSAPLTVRNELDISIGQIRPVERFG